jgi:hypothetical protein
VLSGNSFFTINSNFHAVINILPQSFHHACLQHRVCAQTSFHALVQGDAKFLFSMFLPFDRDLTSVKKMITHLLALIYAILIFKLCSVSGFGPLAGLGFAEDDYPTERRFEFFSFSCTFHQ